MYLISCFGGEQTTTYADVSLEPSGCFQLDQMDKRVSHLNLFKIKIFQNSPSVGNSCSQVALRRMKNTHVLCNRPSLVY